MDNSEQFCKEKINEMLKKSQTKVIFPIITFGLVKEYRSSKKTNFIDSDIRKIYTKAVAEIQSCLGHKFHTGGKYYDAYPIRNLPRYGVLNINNKVFELTSPFIESSDFLIDWIPDAIKEYIDKKLGIIPKLNEDTFRLDLARNIKEFRLFLEKNITLNASNFEVFSFSILKVHLEKFACKVYRDTRTSANDKGVDLSTDFGVVYQIKKLKVLKESVANEILSDIKLNFDQQRMNDGKVILVIDDISKEIKQYLINLKIQSISKGEILKLAEQLEDSEDRMKVLRIIYDEFRREYESQL